MDPARERRALRGRSAGLGMRRDRAVSIGPGTPEPAIAWIPETGAARDRLDRAAGGEGRPGGASEGPGSAADHLNHDSLMSERSTTA